MPLLESMKYANKYAKNKEWTTSIYQKAVTAEGATRTISLYVWILISKYNDSLRETHI